MLAPIALRRLALVLLAAVVLLLALATANVAASSGLSTVVRSDGNDHDHGATADESAEDHGDGHEHDHDAPSAPPTAEERAAADEFVAETLAASARFADFAVDEAEGFVRVTPYHVRGGGPAHFLNPAYAVDDVYLDPNEPESLVYLRAPDGSMHLLGVMFIAPIGDGPTPGGPLTRWHEHQGMCFGPNSPTQPHDESGACPPGQAPIRSEMMHVWTFAHPDGPLAEHLDREAIIAAYRQYVV